jgi:lactoylglutathione lyase
MKYLHTMVRVSDLEASLAFYCDALGLKEIRRYDNEAGRFTLVFLAAPNDEDAQLELTYNWPEEDGKQEKLNGGRNFGHLAYRVENIYETCQDLLDKGIVLNRPPRDGYMAFIRSPDGVSIEILQKGNPLEPTQPWLDMENIGEW